MKGGGGGVSNIPPPPEKITHKNPALLGFKVSCKKINEINALIMCFAICSNFPLFMLLGATF